MIAKLLNLNHSVLELPMIGEILGGSALTDPKIELPEGHYAEESMKTVVPNRNMILLLLQVMPFL